MNALQKKKIKTLVESDCEIQGHYCMDGKTCVIGRLALEAGAKKEELEKVNGLSIDVPQTKWLRELIEKHYGLNTCDQTGLQMRNDGVHDSFFQSGGEAIIERRQKVLEYLEAIPVTPS